MSNFIGVYESAASLDYCTRMITEFNLLRKSQGVDQHGQVEYGGVLKRKDQSIFLNHHDTRMTQETHTMLSRVLVVIVV